jgi:hypothetical protein
MVFEHANHFIPSLVCACVRDGDVEVVSVLSYQMMIVLDPVSADMGLGRALSSKKNKLETHDP